MEPLSQEAIEAEQEYKTIRDALFVRCTSKEALSRWIQLFLQLDLPDCIVTEESNSTPLDMVWEIYNKAISNNDEQFSRVMAYATRGGYKTLGASILEILGLFHLRRNVGHMAATREQSEKSQQYVRDFLALPYLRDFVSRQSAKYAEILYYKNAQDRCISQAEFNKLDKPEQDAFREQRNSITIVICTLSGANGLHCELFCVDGATPIVLPSGAAGRSRKTMTARSLWQLATGGSSGGVKSKALQPDAEIINPGLEVLSYDFDSGQLIPVGMTRMHRTAKECLEINAGRKIVVSKDHPLYVVGRGFIVASELKEGDRLVTLNKGRTTSAKRRSRRRV